MIIATADDMSRLDLADHSANLRTIADALRSVHGCSAAVLYGSHASNDIKDTSDYDVAGFCDIAEARRIAGRWRGSYLDVFLYPLEKLQQPGPALLHLRNGCVLFDTADGTAASLLAALDEVFDRGPEKLPPDEQQARREWAWKMVDRAQGGDPEGDYRRAWLLTALLEDLFLLSGEWYLGPKKSLAHLERHAPELHRAFCEALAPGASFAAIEELVHAVCGPRSTDLAGRALHCRGCEP